MPDRLASLGGAKQLVIVTSASSKTRDGTIQVFDLGGTGNWTQVFSAPTRLGSNGLIPGTQRRQGSRMTPTGMWHLGSFAFGGHSKAPAGTRLAYRAITSDSYWSDVRGSTYNTWVESTRPVSGEHLADDARASYEFAADTGFNHAPDSSVFGRGSGIFIHVMHPGYTAGCVSLPRASMIRLLTILDPAKRPRCIIGTTDKGRPTSIWQY